MDRVPERLVLAAATLALAAACGEPGIRAGGLGGKLFFGEVGELMTDSDKARTVEAVRGNVIGRASTWTSANGTQFSATPTRESDTTAGICRDYVLSGGGREAKGTACRQNDGIMRSPGA